MNMKESPDNHAAGPDSVIDDIRGDGEYKYGFVTDVDTEVIPVGLDEDVVRLISRLKHEPEWLLEFRLKAYRHWLTMTPSTSRP